MAGANINFIFMNPFEFYQDHKNEWRWRLLDANKHQWADSGEGYEQKSSCEKGAQLFTTLGPNASKRKVVEPSEEGNGPEWEYYQDRQQKWRWRFQAGNNKILADGTRGYSTEQEVLDAIKTVINLLKESSKGTGNGSYVPPIVGGATGGGRFA
jgi:uncharacterized protein YegP (UPF0339 family)